MLHLFHIALTLSYVLAALTGAFHTKLPRTVRGLSFAYFGWSLVGQVWAFWFFLGSLASLYFAVSEPVVTLWIAALNAVSAALFLLILHHAWDASKALAKINTDGPSVSLSRFMAGAIIPFRLTRRDVTRLKNIDYGPFGRRNQLDIYRPKTKQPSPMPVLLHVHGGGWVVGSKHQQAQPLIQHMASQGWIVVDINYRLGPWNKMPAMIEDVMRAIAWAKTNIADYDGDPDFIALTGGSAGGHLVALASLTSHLDAFKPGFEDADCAVDACVPVYGVYDFLNRTGAMATGFKEMQTFLSMLVMPGALSTHKDLWDSVSPMAHVKFDAPPTLILHSHHDALADFDSAKAFAEALEQVSTNEVIFAALPSGQHAYDISYAPPTPAHVRAVHRFLEGVRRRASE